MTAYATACATRRRHEIEQAFLTVIIQRGIAKGRVN